MTIKEGERLEDAVGLLWEHSRDAVRMQWEHSGDAVAHSMVLARILRTGLGPPCMSSCYRDRCEEVVSLCPLRSQ